MHTIQIGMKTYRASDPMAARLLREALKLMEQGRTRLARGLISLAFKVEDGTLNAAEAEQLEGPVRAAA